MPRCLCGALIPTTDPLAAQVAADWARFNGGMGADTAVSPISTCARGR